jgi:hypothetical protein
MLEIRKRISAVYFNIMRLAGCKSCKSLWLPRLYVKDAVGGVELSVAYGVTCCAGDCCAVSMVLLSKAQFIFICIFYNHM